MEIGDVLTYRGREYTLRGLEPMSVPGRLADLEDPVTGELVRAPVEELRPRFDEEERS